MVDHRQKPYRVTFDGQSAVVRGFAAVAMLFAEPARTELFDRMTALRVMVSQQKGNPLTVTLRSIGRAVQIQRISDDSVTPFRQPLRATIHRGRAISTRQIDPVSAPTTVEAESWAELVTAILTAAPWATELMRDREQSLRVQLSKRGAAYSQLTGDDGQAIAVAVEEIT